MHFFIRLTLLAALWLPASSFAQNATRDTMQISCRSGGSIAVNSIGRTRIHFKDGTVRKDCILKEFKDQWLIYEKDGSLHDAEVEKISWIEFADKVHAIYFDEKSKPVVWFIQ
jgi:hypothetical protein